MSRRLRTLILMVALAVIAAISVDASAKRAKHARVHRSKSTEQCASSTPTQHAAAQPASETANPLSAAELALVKQAVELLRKHKPAEATEIKNSIGDPAAKKLVEWVILRSENGDADFNRYARFIHDNPAWPSISLLRPRAEAALWQERRSAAVVRSFLIGGPASAKGRLVLARVRLAEGDRAGAEDEIREAWWTGELSENLEAQILDLFPGFLTRGDHRARMDRRIGAKDFAGAMRAAHHLGGDEISIVKACAAATKNSDKARALLEAVPAEARQDLGYTLCRVHWLLRNDGFAEASRVILESPRGAMVIQDTDEWWRARRLVARKLLDSGDAATAYRIVHEAAPPANEYYRADFHFMAGWLKLRFLDDPAGALAHFAHVDDGTTNPIVLARAAYWRGRAAEAAGRSQEARAQYETAARYPTAYYGQLARTKIGLDEVVLRPPPDLDPASDAARSAREIVRAVGILYAIGERRLVVSIAEDLAEHGGDVATLVGLAELTARHQDAQATLLIGKGALGRGLPLELHAFPDFGVPHYKAIGPAIDPSIAYSVVRTESGFDQRDRSPAKAVGLMQVTPEAGRDTAGRFGVTYDWNKLVCDPVYNTQMGAAELAALLREYRGSYMMTFAGYNAGRGRVDQWIKQHGDPRESKVDPVDWVERIPFSETRNYVQRVMENLQVYRARFAGSTQSIEAGLSSARGEAQISMALAEVADRSGGELVSSDGASGSLSRAAGVVVAPAKAGHARSTSHSSSQTKHHAGNHRRHRPASLGRLKVPAPAAETTWGMVGHAPRGPTRPIDHNISAKIR